MSMRKLLSAFLAVVIAAGVFAAAQKPVYAATEEPKWNKIDEQRAVNLTPSQLATWVQKKKYNCLWETVRDQNGNVQYLVCTVTHKDTAGKIYKALIAGGKTVIKQYISGVVQAARELPADIVLGEVKSDLDDVKEHLNKSGVENALSYESMETAEDLIGQALEQAKDLLVVSQYYFTSDNSPAVCATVVMSKDGRFYGASEKWDDAWRGKTADGYSKKKPSVLNKYGYYYKQEAVKIAENNYWKIVVKPW